MMLGAVVPTRNESLTIGPLVTALSKFCDKVVVADDSEDATPWVASSAGARTVSAKGGLDAAYWFGQNEIPEEWWVLHIDAGGSHRATDGLDLVDYAAQHGSQVTIGSRFVDGALYIGRPLRRRQSRLMASMMNLVTRWDINDWTSGMRLYSPQARKVIRDHRFQTHGHAWQIEALWAAKMAGMTHAEVPIVYTAGQSQMSAGRAWEASKLWAKVLTS